MVDDGQQSVGVVVSAATKAGECSTAYDPFGNVLAANAQTTNSITPLTGACSAGATADDYFYRGMRRDADTGNYQMGTRTYDPSWASFIEPDEFRAGAPGMSIGLGTDPSTRNRYTYAGGDPVNMFDPTGHWPSLGGIWNSVKKAASSVATAVSHAYTQVEN